MLEEDLALHGLGIEELDALLVLARELERHDGGEVGHDLRMLARRIAARTPASSLRRASTSLSLSAMPKAPFRISMNGQ